MKDFRGTYVEIAAKQLALSEPFIWLIEVEVPTDPPTRYRITNYNSDVSYGVNSLGQPTLYHPFPVVFGDLLEQRRGDLPEITINVGNAGLEMMADLELYNGLVDVPVRIRLVNSAALNDPNAQSQVNGKIARTRVRDDLIAFTISQTNLTKVFFPSKRLLAHDCQHRFGGPDCGYIIPPGATNVIGGGFNFCARTFEDCGIRGDDEVARSLTRLHPLRFDGCPGIKGGTPA